MLRGSGNSRLGKCRILARFDNFLRTPVCHRLAQNISYFSESVQTCASRVWIMEVAVIKNQSPLAVEETIKKLLKNDVIYTAVPVSLVNQTIDNMTIPLFWGAYRLEIISALLQTSNNAFNGLVASYIGPYTFQEAVYLAEITAMVFWLACLLTFPPTVQLVSAKGKLCMLPHLKLVATPLFYLIQHF